VVGFDDVEMASIVSPPLTTVQIPRYDMGSTAMNLLLKAMKKEIPLSPGEYMKTALVVRGSV